MKLIIQNIKHRGSKKEQSAICKQDDTSIQQVMLHSINKNDEKGGFPGLTHVGPNTLFSFSKIKMIHSVLSDISHVDMMNTTQGLSPLPQLRQFQSCQHDLIYIKAFILNFRKYIYK